MAKHNELGKSGESIACEYLRSKGYELLVKNYRTSRGELDLVFRQQKQIVFVEVKTRTYVTAFDSFIPISRSKKRAIYSAVRLFLQRERYDWEEIRFDLVYVTQGRVIEHIEGESFW